MIGISDRGKGPWRPWPRRAAVGLAAVALLAFALWPVGLLEVRESRSGRLLFRGIARPGETFTLRYIHSVDRAPVSGLFAVAPDGRIAILETIFSSLGPGLPTLADGDEYVQADGKFHLRTPGRFLPELSFFVHPFTDHRLTIQGTTLDLSHDLPEGSLVAVRARRSSILGWLFGR